MSGTLIEHYAVRGTVHSMRLGVVLAGSVLALSAAGVAAVAATGALSDTSSSTVDTSSWQASDVVIELQDYTGPTNACLQRPTPGEQSGCLIDLSRAATESGQFGAALAILREGVSRSEDMVGRCHNETHEVGWALAESGMPLAQLYEVPFPDCRFGFYHGGMTQVAEDFTLDELVEALPALCASFGSAELNSTQECVHATGHLLTDRLGSDLSGALQACSAFQEQSLQGRCADGVLMQAIDLVRPGVEDPQDPSAQQIVDTWGATREEQERSVRTLCDGLPNSDMVYVCYTNVSQTLAVLWKEDYVNVTRVCDESPQEWRRACYEGVAASAFTLRSWDPRGIAEACHASNAEETKYCMGSMAHSFGLQDTPDRAALVCDLARKYERKACLEGVQAGAAIRAELFSTTGASDADLPSTSLSE